MKSVMGRTLPVLFEREEDGFSLGHSDTYQLVRVKGAGLRGKTRDVLVTAQEGEKLYGELV